MRTTCSTCGKVAGSPELDESLALHRDWLVTMHHVPAEHLHAAIQEHNTKVCALLDRCEPSISDARERRAKRNGDKT